MEGRSIQWRVRQQGHQPCGQGIAKRLEVDLRELERPHHVENVAPCGNLRSPDTPDDDRVLARVGERGDVLAQLDAARVTVEPVRDLLRIDPV